ncbi:unnamed protein product [Cyclocybe aegerita]|uniref:Uncharacterized protein n=1 Tax=Cyclocybe aegerita TaxID=1973307 RepID=A0A8S0WIF0_CYCAE|nr:unnamed protein product [Cyclocybe aegerita]
MQESPDAENPKLRLLESLPLPASARHSDLKRFTPHRGSVSRTVIVSIVSHIPPSASPSNRETAHASRLPIPVRHAAPLSLFISPDLDHWRAVRISSYNLHLRF